MRGYASAILLGNLTQDIEIKESQNGKTFGIMNLAVNRHYNGEEHVSFFKCMVFGKLVDAIGKYLTKGKPVMVEAEPQQNKWKDKEGNNRYDISFNVKSIQLLPSGKQDSGQPTMSFDDDIPI